jgi:hypothetical protein
MWNFRGAANEELNRTLRELLRIRMHDPTVLVLMETRTYGISIIADEIIKGRKGRSTGFFWRHFDVLER